MYLTVKRGVKRSEVLKEIREEFKCEAEKYFEILRQPKKTPKFKLVSKPKSGGSIAVGNKQFQASSESENEQFCDLQSSGTLTMFCSQNSDHYALTCFHVACATDEKCFQQMFNQQELLDIQERREHYEEHAKEREYYYKRNEVDSTDENDNPINYIPLGKFSKCSLHSESDIMSIKVREDVEIECTTPEIDHPDWVRIEKDLFDRILSGSSEDRISVEKFGYPLSSENSGCIRKLYYSYRCEEGLLFKNAIVVKGNSQTFLEDGDSGALISFVDKDKNKQAFAYGVCEVDDIYNENTYSESSEDSSEDLSENSSEGSSKDSSDGDKSELGDEIINIKPEGGKECGDSDDNSIEFGEEVLRHEELGPFAICLRLKTALKDLGLSDAGCFKNCRHTLNVASGGTPPE